MNILQTETSHLEPASGWAGERAAWQAEQTTGVLYRDNLIYLPFAAHLSDEDMSAEVYARAA